MNMWEGSGEKKKILVIDDEENFTKLIKWNLEEKGNYAVRVENNGWAGLSAAKEFKPHLIFLDLIMPDIEGGDVCNMLGRDKETKNIPIVILTAIARKNEVEENKGFIAGHPFLAKPVSLKEILDCLARHGL